MEEVESSTTGVLHHCKAHEATNTVHTSRTNKGSCYTAGYRISTTLLYHLLPLELGYLLLYTILSRLNFNSRITINITIKRQIYLSTANTVRLGSRCRSVFKTREFRFDYLTHMIDGIEKMSFVLAFSCKSNIGRDIECKKSNKFWAQPMIIRIK